MKTSSLVAAALVAAAPLAAQQTAPAAAQDRTHTVQAGETLWSISQSYLADPFLWPEIFRLNIGTVRDPARIYPRQQLVLPEGAAQRTAGAGDRTIFYPTDTGGAQRILGADEIARSAVTPGDFYRAPFLAQTAEVPVLGRVAETVSPTVVDLQITPQVQPYDRVNVALAQGSAVRVGDHVQLLRADAKPGTLGRVYYPTGLATVTALDNGTAVLVVTDVLDRISKGDIVAPSARFAVPVGVRPGTSAGPDARLIGFAGNHTVYMVEEHAFMDVGRAQGIREGDEFEAYQPAGQATWGTQPPVAIARLQVVRVTANTATARVVSQKQPALALGLPVRRVLQMP